MGNTYLVHHGVKGQKWGQRRFQNKDGSLTAEGRLHYGVDKSGSRITENVKEGTIRGAKKGAALGAGVGGGVGALLGAAAVASVPGMPAAIAASVVLSNAGAMALRGAVKSAAFSAAWSGMETYFQDKRIQQKVANGEKFVEDIPELTRTWVLW